MKKLKRMISTILLFCLIVSMVPLVQKKASAAAGVTYVLDTDGIDPGATYLVVGAVKPWGSNTTTYYALNGAGEPGAATIIADTDGKTVNTFDGVENCEWVVEAGTNSLLHNGKYLKLNTSGTAAPLEYQDVPFPLFMSNTNNYAKLSEGKYIVNYYDSTAGKYGYLAVSSSYTPPFKSMGSSSLTWVNGVCFFKRVDPSYTVTYNGNGMTTGVLPNNTTDLKAGDSYTVLPPKEELVKEAGDDTYLFKGWCDTADGTGNVYTPGDTITINGSMTLYAYWELQVKHTVTVETRLDGEDWNIEEILGEAVTLYIGNDGNMWPLENVGEGVYAAKITEVGTYSVFILHADASLEKTDYTITVDGQDDTVQLQYYSVRYVSNGATFREEVYPSGSWVTVISDTPTADNNTFLGWEDANGKLLKSGSVIFTSLQEQVVLTAKWQEMGNLKYVIRYREKTTEKELQASTTIDGVAAGTEILAEHVAQKIVGYTYAGAGISGQFYEKAKNPSMIISEDESENVITIYYTPDPDLHLHKDAILENDGTYTIEMNMFTHNNPVTTLVNQDIPLDIVLVLDQSSSMFTSQVHGDLKESVTTFINLVAEHSRENEADHRLAIVGYGNIDEYGATGGGHIAGSYSKTTGKTIKGEGYWTNTGVFDAHGDFHSYPITGFNYTEYDGEVNPGGTYYTFSVEDQEFLVLDYHEEYYHLVAEHEAYEESLDGTTIYGYVDGRFVELTRNSSSMWLYGNKELYSSEKFFTRHEKVWTHREGINARQIHAYMVDGVYTPTDGHNNIYTREETQGTPQKSIYRDALIPVTTGAYGAGFIDPVFTKAVNDLGAKGKTYISYGMQMANRIFEANPVEELNEDVDRQRVIVVFTDGKPGDSTNFDEIESNKALKESAYAASEYGALVYTIGLYGEETVNAESDQDYFMNGLSSNFPNADNLDKVWLSTKMIPALAGTSLNIGGPYYAKIGENYHPLEHKVGWVEDPENPGKQKIVSMWRYTNGDEIVTISQMAISTPQRHPVITAYEENGETKIGVNGVEIYRKAGAGYQNAASSQYYSKTSDPTELEYYFASIVQELTTKISKEVLLEDNTILRDIMGQGLVLTPGTVITVSAQAGIFNPEEKKVDWSEEVIPLDQLVIPENPAATLHSEKGITVDGTFIPYISVYNLNAQNPTSPNEADYHPHTVDIAGYQYDKWYMNASKLEGFRLVATITRVEARDNVPWGRATDTNHAQSGLWLPADANGDRELLEAFDQPSTVFVERVYVLDYGKQFQLGGWYFDDEDGKDADVVHVDCQIDNGMNWFDEENPTTANGENRGNTRYGNVTVSDGNVVYTPVTTQWGGYDQFYVFGNTWRNTVVTQDANRNGNLWNKVMVIPANNIYYEDSFVTDSESGGVNGISGFAFTGDWEVVYTDDDAANAGLNEENPEHQENQPYGEVHGWTDSLGDDFQYSDGSAHMAGGNSTMGAKATFQFTGTGVDVYTRTNQFTGIVVAVLKQVDTNEPPLVKSLALDNLAMSGDYYQIPTVSFMDLPYGTYQVELIATAASNVATGAKRYEYYLDGIRVYNPLGNVSHESEHVLADAYGKELNAVYTEIRDVILRYDDFNYDIPDNGQMGAVFIDWIQEGQESGSDQTGTGNPTYEVGTTFNTYGPKNEIYLSQGQAIVLKVDPTNNYYVGMKNLTPGKSVMVNVTGTNLKDPTTISVGHTTDMYYEVTPMDGFIVIQNASNNGALLALTKLRTTNMHEDITSSGIAEVEAKAAVTAVYDLEEALESKVLAPLPEEPETPPLTLEQIRIEENKKLAQNLFTNVRTWLQAG